MELYCKQFEELTTKELYEILRVRQDIFIIEQECIYPELDGIDYESLHLYMEENGKIQSYLRLFYKEENVVQIGRVLAVKRREGIGSRLLEAAIQIAFEKMKAEEIYLEAQTYALEFYTRQGFEMISEEFLEDGIPHRKMLLKRQDS